jgi:2-dehydro-3-deoxyphosphooctonate aldolase (KDO 8-P synthase)
MPRTCTIGAIEGGVTTDTIAWCQVGDARRPTSPSTTSTTTPSTAPDCGLVAIAGPCLLESESLARDIAAAVVDAGRATGISVVFKGSFDKANRSSIRSPRGPGLARGVDILARIRTDFRVPVTTDIHEPAQAAPVAEVVDLLQVPAFLCRQTDLLSAIGLAAVARGRAVNVKKGQFLSPGEMVGAVRKLGEAGCANIMLTERGTTFGYHRLVNDFIGLKDLMHLPAPGGAPPVCFDCTHSTQTPGTGDTTGGRPDAAPLLARAAVAAGVHAVFIECHPDPASAMSDASTMLPLAAIRPLFDQLAAIRRALARPGVA